jgi:hypothetical protein
MSPRDHFVALVLTMVTGNQNFRASPVPLLLELDQNGPPDVVRNTDIRYLCPDMGAGLIENGAGWVRAVALVGGL